MKKRFFAGLAATMMVAVLAITSVGCKPAASKEKVLKLNNNSEPGSLHPQLATGSHDSWIIDHCFEGLYSKDPKGGPPILGVAKSVDVSQDGKVYTFHLKDTKWSNGDPVTAQDFYTAWKFALLPETASEYAYQLFYIVGAENLNSSKETNVQPLVDKLGIKVIDPKTLQVTINNPTPYFPDLLTHYTYRPINTAAQEKLGKAWADTPENYVSNGAFYLTEWAHKSQITISKNKNFYDAAKVKLDKIQFAIVEEETTAYQMYTSGELDYLYPIPADVIAKLKAENNKELVIGSDLAVYYYMLNTTLPGLKNVKVRKALAMALDRNAIVTNVTKGNQTPAFSLTPIGIPDGKGDYSKNIGPLFKEDVAEAKKLLAEGLKEEGLDKLSFTLLYNTSENHKKIAEAAQDMWRKNLGVEVTLENQEFQVVLDRRTALDYNVCRAGWIGDFVDPMTFVDLWTSYSTLNETGWTSAEYDKLVKDSMATTDITKRMDLLKSAEKILMQEMPVIPFYFYTQPNITKPYVTGSFKPVNRYTQFMYADITK